MSKKDSKISKKEEYEKKKNEQIFPVFRMKILGAERAQCKYLGNVSNENDIMDEGIELTTVPEKNPHGAFAVKLGVFKKYEVFMKACSCNIVGSYLLANKKYPVFYLTLIYASQLVSGQLFSSFLYFTPDEDILNTLEKPKQYVNRTMAGKYTLELLGDDSFLATIIEKKTPEVEEKVMIEYMDRFENATDEEKDALGTEINEKVQKKLDEYRELFLAKEINGTPSKTKTLNIMEQTFRKDIFKELINICIDIRNEERIKDKCPDMTYEKPKRVIDLKLFKEHPEKMEEFLDNLSDYERENEDSNY